jgi:hypothetical protein
MTIGYNEVEEGTIPLHQLNPRSRATSRRGQHPGGRRSFDGKKFHVLCRNRSDFGYNKEKGGGTLI